MQPEKEIKKPVEPKYLYHTGLTPLSLAKTLKKTKGSLDHFVNNPKCWICSRRHNESHGTLQRMGSKGTLIPQNLIVRYIDVQMHYGQIIRIPICEVCVLLINRAAQKKIHIVEELAPHSEDIDNR
jgi:hypothetical protein